jgi:excisionase family DNA binding protein
MSVTSASTTLGISRQRVYQLIREERLPSRKTGARYWVPITAVTARRHAEELLRSDECIGTQEVADFFGVNERTVRDWNIIGLLKAENIGNTLCFQPADVIAFVPPSSSGGAGRPPARQPSRSLRGTKYPEQRGT